MTETVEYGTVDGGSKEQHQQQNGGVQADKKLDEESDKVLSSRTTNHDDDQQQEQHWKILTLGQGLSVLLASMLATQSTIYLDCGWSSPGLSCTFAYVLLCFYLIPLYNRGRAVMFAQVGPSKKDSDINWFLGIFPLQASSCVYLGMSFLSFYGNYLNLLAIRYTTITSITLFDALSIPTAMILSRLIFQRKYGKWHILAAFLCLLGILCNVGIDVVANYLYATNQSVVVDDGSKTYPQKILGDIMACGGGILWGANDVLAELAVRRYGGATEYLAMVGFFSMFIGIIHTVIFERDSAYDLFNYLDFQQEQQDEATSDNGVCTGSTMAGLLIVYTMGQVSRKAGLAFFLTLSDAALLQLSLLTSDLYTAIFSILYQGIFPRTLFWVAMILVISGIVLYEMGPSPTTISGKNDSDYIMKNIDKDGVVWFDVDNRKDTNNNDNNNKSNKEAAAASDDDSNSTGSAKMNQQQEQPQDLSSSSTNSDENNHSRQLDPVV